MNDIIAMHRADLVDAVTDAVKPLKEEIERQKEIVVSMRKLNSKVIAEKAALEARCATAEKALADLEHATRGQTFQTPDEKDKRIAELEAALRDLLHNNGSYKANQRARELTALETKGDDDVRG